MERRGRRSGERREVHPLLVREEKGTYDPRLGQPPARRRTVTVRRPGQRGTRRLMEHYGDKLVCVRYIEDVQRRRRYKTVELIVEEAVWTPPPPPPPKEVGVRVAYHEVALRKRVRAAGARWDHKTQLWRMPRKEALAMRLKERIVDLPVGPTEGE